MGAYGAAIGAVVGAGSSASGAISSNNAIKAAMKRSAKNTGVQRQQVANQADQARERRLLETEKIRGRVRVAAAEAGVGSDGSFGAVEGQNEYASELDTLTIGRNAYNTDQRIVSEYDSTQAQLRAGYRNPLLAAFSGALSGASAGAGLGSGGKAAFSSGPEPNLDTGGRNTGTNYAGDAYSDPSLAYPGAPSQQGSRLA